METLTPTDWLPWVVMWALAAAIFAACKWLTWWRTTVPSATVWRQVAYIFAWPGLDAKAFLDPKPIAHAANPTPGEWVFASAKLVFGIALVWCVVPLVPLDYSILRGWVGMTGIVFILHFGAFHLLSCVWRAAGVDAKPLMVWPILAVSVSEFWGRRWNTAFRDMAHRFLFRPLASRLGARAGVAAGFLFSGIVHDLVISVPAGGGYGWPTLYFMIQGLGLLVEKSTFGKSLGLGAGWKGRLFAAVVVIGPACGLFHRPFILNVILPFLAAIGAG